MEDLKLSIIYFLEKYKVECVVLSSAVISCIVSVIVLISSQQTIEEPLTATFPDKPLSEIKNAEITIDLSGSVNKPDTYTINPASRLKDLIDLAGGLSEEADKDFFSKNFNLARKLVDQEKIFIPSIEDVQNNTVQGVSTDQNKVNINTASLEELIALPNIGNATAQKILDSRPYNSLDELTTKQVLKKAIYDKLKDLISL